MTVDVFRTVGTARQGLLMYGGRFQDHSENFAGLGAIAAKKRETFLTSFHSRSPYREGPIVENMTFHHVAIQGGPVASEIATHLTVGGHGLIPIRDSDNRLAYTRVGTFNLNENRIMMNHLGHKLLVVKGKNGVFPTRVPSEGSFSVLDLKNVSSPPQATSSMILKQQLPGSTPQPVNQTVPFYDSLGGQHSLIFNWTYVPSIGDPGPTGATHGWRLRVIAPPGATVKVDPSSPYSSDQGVLLEFDGKGTLLGVNGTKSNTQIDPNDPNFISTQPNPAPRLSVTSWGNAAGPSNVELNFGTLGRRDGVVSHGNQFNLIDIVSNGHPFGAFSKIDFDDEGFGTITYTNGVKDRYCRIPLVLFNNPNGLRLLDTGIYVPHIREDDEVGIVGSGEAEYLFPKEENAGKIIPASYEGSNINATEVYVNMVEDERRYANNLSVLKTAGEMADQLNALI